MRCIITKIKDLWFSGSCLIATVTGNSVVQHREACLHPRKLHIRLYASVFVYLNWPALIDVCMYRIYLF